MHAGILKENIGDRCAVVVTVQNDEFGMAPKCFILRTKNEYLMRLGYHKPAKMNQNIQIYNVWATSLKSIVVCMVSLGLRR